MLLLCGGLLAGPPLIRVVNAQADPPDPEVMLVTTGSDAVLEPECPHASDCSLRAAIVAANAIEGDDPVEIRFSATSFPAANPVTIELVDALPAITRAQVTITGAGAGGRIDGSDLPEPLADANGLVVEGDGGAVAALAISNFGGTCLHVAAEDVLVGGDPAMGEGLAIDHCPIGIAIAGEGAIVAGNRIGLAGAEDDPRMAVALRITGDGAQVGVLPGDEPPPAGNIIGHAGIGIDVAAAGALIRANRIGSDGESPAPVGTAIRLTATADDATIRNNTIAYSEGAAVALAARETNSANRISQNTYEQLGGPAIDHLDDGARNPNDSGDGDAGPNGLLNHPEPGRATTTFITGLACANCLVELYLAAHVPGAAADQPTVFLADSVATAAGVYTFTGLPLAAGSWVMASATAGDGATSEFGPSTRVGSGEVQCAPTTLGAGWTFAAFTGANVTLGLSFPESGEGAGSVLAIYELEPGTGTFRRWIAGTTIGRTLPALEPGKAYFFLSSSPVVLGGGFTLSEPFPVALSAGWNAVAYIGSGDDYRDALGSLGDGLLEAYRFTSLGRWEATGAAGTPAWARDFTVFEGCRAYMIEMSAARLLVPLQP